MRYSKRAVWLVGLLVVVLGAGVVAMTQAAGAAPNPAGNNGTIKFDREPFDDAPNNQPHVGCVFQVDFYGFDQGDLHADVTFTAQPPTLRPGDDQVLLADTVFIGEDDNSGGGSQAGLDASKQYTLDFAGLTPHPVQGFHVKLTIHAAGSQGADTKYKVFWVTGCKALTTTTTAAPRTTVSKTTTTTTAGETTTTIGQATTVGETTTTTMAGGRHPTTLGQGPSGKQLVTSKHRLPFTGSNALAMAASGLLLVLVGVGGLLASRRWHTR